MPSADTPFGHEPFEYDAAYDLPEYVGVPRMYVMATTQRTGSHFLAHLLARTPWGGVPFEYVNRFRVARELAVRKLPHTDAHERELLLEMQRRRTGCTGLFGLKAHWHSWHDTFTRPGICGEVCPEAVIYLARRDRDAQARSLAIAEQTGTWVSFGVESGRTVSCSSEALDDARLRIEAECAEWERYLSETWRGPTLALCFEDVRDDPWGAVEEVRRFLGAPAGTALRDLPMPTPTSVRLVSPQPGELSVRG